MPKVQQIILQLQSSTFQNLPQISHILQSDIDRLVTALKKNKNDKSYYAILRYVLSQVKKRLGHKDYSIPLMEIGLSQIQGKPFVNQLKIKICESIIQLNEAHLITMLENFINQLTDTILKPQQRAKLQIIRAGKQYLKGDYLKASFNYLNASKDQYFILQKDQQKRIQLINKAIAFSFISSINQENKKLICTLCLNQLTKKSKLQKILNKLYIQDLITQQDCQLIKQQLPLSLIQSTNSHNNEFIDIEISILNRAKFWHNLQIIRNSFDTISFRTISRLLGIHIQTILILFESQFCLQYDQKSQILNSIKIDQQSQFIQFKKLSTQSQSKQRILEFFNKIDDILQA